MYIGDFALGKTFDVKFTTVSTTGAPTTLAGSPVVSAYPDNSTTELTAGITLTVDFDSRTGMHNVRVVASGGNGYATATNYALVITTGTVGGTSVVGYVIGHFSLENRSALRPATADRTLVVDAAGLADATAVKVGPTGAATAQTAGDIPARLPAALGANGNIKADLRDSIGVAVTSAAGRPEVNMTHAAGTAWNAGGITTGTFAAGAIDNAAIATDAIGSAELAASAVTEIQSGLSTLDAAGVRTAVGLASANLDTQLSSIQSDTDNLQTRLPAALGANGNLKADVRDFNGTAGTFASGRPEVNATHAAGTAWNSGAITTGTFAAGAIDNAAIATDAIGSAELAASAVTEIQTGLSTLDAAAVRTAVGLASANLDTQLSGIQSDTNDLQTRVPAALVSGKIDAALSAAGLATDAAQEIADTLLDRTDGVETGLTVRQAHRLEAAAAAGKLSGAATSTITIRNAVADTKNRVVATVDADGNRSAITTDLT